MNSTSGTLYDGMQAQGIAVRLRIVNTDLHWQSDTAQGVLALENVRMDPVPDSGQAILHAPGGLQIMVEDTDWLSRWPRQSKLERISTWLEARKHRIVLSLLLSIGLVFAVLKWGVPAAAQAIVPWLPQPLIQAIGQESLKSLDRVTLSESRLPQSRQDALRQALAEACNSKPCPAYELHFRRGRTIGANALALPGGHLVLTDELVKTASHDHEILAVLAHEMGHEHHQHGLRMVFQRIGASTILVGLLGDLSSVFDLASLSAVLLASGYSRQMEQEADDYAWNWLQQRCIPTSHMASILGKLDKSPKDPHWLSTHPHTEERMRHFRQSHENCAS